MFGMFSASVAAQVAQREQKRIDELQHKAALASQQHSDELARLVARRAIDGRAFKCGPWAWRFRTYLLGNVERIR